MNDKVYAFITDDLFLYATQKICWLKITAMICSEERQFHILVAIKALLKTAAVMLHSHQAENQRLLCCLQHSAYVKNN